MVCGEPPLSTLGESCIDAFRSQRQRPWHARLAVISARMPNRRVSDSAVILGCQHCQLLAM